MPPSFWDAGKGIDEAPGTTAIATAQPKAGRITDAHDWCGRAYRYRCCCCCNLFPTIRCCRRNGRMGTLIRHAGLNPASSILALAVAMIQSSFGTGLVSVIGRTALPPPRRCAASHTAIALPAVTVRTNEEQHVAGAAQTKPRPQNRLAMYSHVPGVRALTTAIRSWDVKNQLRCVVDFPKKVATKPEPRRYERRGSLPSRSTSTVTDDD
jgi:hypothetical protein